MTGTAREIARIVEQAHRDHWTQVLAATVRLTRDLDLAQDCAQEAYLRALRTWGSALPAEPTAWLTTVARRIALDAIRRSEVLRRKLPLLIEPIRPDRRPEDERPTDALLLMFICCHPALAPDSRVALTLRLVCGLSTVEVASGLLIPEATAAARITRAKKKIAGAGIPFRVPADHELPDRLDVLLTALQVMSAAGHVSGGAGLQRTDLLDRAIDIARTLVGALPPPAVDEAVALLAHLLLTRARGDARSDESGHLVLLAEQDRSRWDTATLMEGLGRIADVLGRITAADRTPGRFTVQAVIAGLHMNARTFQQTDWAQITRWYDELLQRWPTPVVSLNALVARSHLAGVDRPAILAALDALAQEPMLHRYPYLPAARAVLLSRWGDAPGAIDAYDRAIGLCRNEIERRHLRRQRAALD